MPLEQQLTSLIPSQRLRELNVKQESLYYWVQGTNGWFITTESMVSMCPTEYGECSAFTVAELGEMLPERTQTWKFQNGWLGRCDKFPQHHVDIEVSADTEADARALMLIFLLENKLITLN